MAVPQSQWVLGYHQRWIKGIILAISTNFTQEIRSYGY